MNTKGQVSWIWVIIAVSLMLMIATFQYIIMDQSRVTMRPNFINYGAAVDNKYEGRLTILDSMWMISPVAILLGWGLPIWAVSLATRGGDYANL